MSSPEWDLDDDSPSSAPKVTAPKVTDTRVNSEAALPLYPVSNSSLRQGLPHIDRNILHAPMLAIRLYERYVANASAVMFSVTTSGR